MEDEVGVAADGGGEVGVVGEAEAEVGAAFGLVGGALHAAQEGEGDHVLVGFPNDGAGDAVEAFHAGRGGAVAESAQFGGHAGPLFVGGFVMDAVDAGDAGFEDLAGDGLVGGEHAFFDEIVGFGGRALGEAHGMAGGIEDAADFGQGEV